MSPPRRILMAVLVAIAAAMIATAAVVSAGSYDRAVLEAIGGYEIAIMAVLVLPFASVSSHRAALLFGPGDAGWLAWRMLSIGSVLLTIGQITAYLPLAVPMGPATPILLLLGQLLPATCRIMIIWSLWRMLGAYRETGIDFHLKLADKLLMAAVIAGTVVLIVRAEVVYDYWTPGTAVGLTGGLAARGAQLFNFLLYPFVLFLSLAMARFALQMGGGLVARAWGGVATYGLLQVLHVVVIATLYDTAGPMISLALDNFIVLAAFGSLAMGPIFQVEAAEVRRSSA